MLALKVILTNLVLKNSRKIPNIIQLIVFKLKKICKTRFSSKKLVRTCHFIYSHQARDSDEHI